MEVNNVGAAGQTGKSSPASQPITTNQTKSHVMFIQHACLPSHKFLPFVLLERYNGRPSVMPATSTALLHAYGLANCYCARNRIRGVDKQVGSHGRWEPCIVTD